MFSKERKMRLRLKYLYNFIYSSRNHADRFLLKVILRKIEFTPWEYQESFWLHEVMPNSFLTVNNVTKPFYVTTYCNKSSYSLLFSHLKGLNFMVTLLTCAHTHSCAHSSRLSYLFTQWFTNHQLKSNTSW